MQEIDSSFCRYRLQRKICIVLHLPAPKTFAPFLLPAPRTLCLHPLHPSSIATPTMVLLPVWGAGHLMPMLEAVRFLRLPVVDPPTDHHPQLQIDCSGQAQSSSTLRAPAS
ncbi:hypothetical protein PR202_gb05771 [Eleusine coracana subsp. coracana]|uniref:Uncharacterized protein n=1 Tax=Eleusine coracana subsp. coracana TaxID=191504 RepID=A0AAV5E816_ELECO|nr:hypothetical protein PR202_gb05771 [Eleusine coracana subsp. coracana]